MEENEKILLPVSSINNLLAAAYKDGFVAAMNALSGTLDNLNEEKWAQEFTKKILDISNKAISKHASSKQTNSEKVNA